MRPRGRARDIARELHVLWHEFDAVAIAPRAAGALYLVGGLLAIAAAAVAPGMRAAYPVAPIGLCASAFGAIFLVLPWQRWPARAQLVIPVFAFVLFAWGGLAGGDPAGPYLAILPIPFVFVGFTQPRGTSLALSPLAALTLIIAAHGSMDETLIGSLVFALPMSVLVGETIAQAQRNRRRAEARIERLLGAVRVLAHVDDERAGAQLVAELAAELLEAQAASVLLADEPHGRRYLNRAFFGHPALADVAPLLLDAFGEEQPSLASRVRFLTVKRNRAAARAAAIVPLPGEGAPLGVIIAMWATPRHRLNAAARQATELLSEEAGRMFQRLRASAALAHDAQTDPLTELANRRTFTHALDLMQPDDALVVVDLDHFKSVNDRFGHQYGDQTLRALARCLRDTARQVDCVARYGGEEFAIVLPNAGLHGALSMLARTRVAWDSTNPPTTFSAGIAVRRAGESPRDTLRRADIAMYDAKQRGRDRDVVAEDLNEVAS
jgi:diguanylate cyclase (GGDEF)-like protein